MENNNIPVMQPESEQAPIIIKADEVEQEKYNYSFGEGLYAWFCLVAGFFICKVGTAVAHPLGALIFIIVLFGASSVALKCHGACFGKASLVIALSAALASVSVFITANGFLQFIAWVYCLGAYCLFVYTATGNSVNGGLSNYILADLVRAVFILPMTSLGNVFSAAFTGKKGRGASAVGKAVLGLLIAIIPTTVALLLLSYDSEFTRIIDVIFDFDFGDIISNIGCALFGIPVAMYIFGMFMAGRNKRCADVLTAEKWDEGTRKYRFLPQITTVSAVVPILVIYVIFFISQWNYYVSGFSGELPGGISYTDYAREGFFQLCAVAVMNLIIVSVVHLIMRRNAEKPSATLKGISIAFAVSTLILISTAFAKMIMYIENYGLTPKRVYASWFMLLLAIIFVLLIVKQFAARFKIVLVTVAVSVVMFTGLAVSGVDYLIASYNVNRYLDGSLAAVDVEAMMDLGDSAVPHMVRLGKELEKRQGTDMSDVTFTLSTEKNVYNSTAAYLYYQKEYNSEKGFFKLTLPAILADNALEKVDLDWDDLQEGEAPLLREMLGRRYY